MGMEPVRPLREVFAGLADHAAGPEATSPDAQSLLADYADLPDDLLVTAIGSYASTAPAEVAEHLAEFVAAPDTDPAEGLNLLASAPTGNWLDEVDLSDQPDSALLDTELLNGEHPGSELLGTDDFDPEGFDEDQFDGDQLGDHQVDDHQLDGLHVDDLDSADDLDGSADTGPDSGGTTDGFGAGAESVTDAGHDLSDIDIDGEPDLPGVDHSSDLPTSLDQVDDGLDDDTDGDFGHDPADVSDLTTDHAAHLATDPGADHDGLDDLPEFDDFDA
jgi:hypothetical protein